MDEKPQRTFVKPRCLRGSDFHGIKNKFNTIGWPDLELLFIAGCLNSDPGIYLNFGLNETIYRNTYSGLGNMDVFMVFPMFLRPKSQGRIMLRSRYPKIYPELIPNYLDQPKVLKKIIEGIKVAMEIARQPAMKEIGVKLYDVPPKGCLQFGPFGSDAYFACQTRLFTFTIYHQAGTCKMGSVLYSYCGPTAENIWCWKPACDRCEHHARIVSSHPSAAVFMIAEKGSDRIKQDWGKL